MRSKTFANIVSAIKAGKLKEPFTERDFRQACPGLPEGTYRAFLHKHARANTGQYSNLFERVAPGKFICIKDGEV